MTSISTEKNALDVSRGNPAHELAVISRPSQTLIVLPFVLAYMLIGVAWSDGSWLTCGSLVLCTILCRVSGRAFNHLVDHEYDSENPRTRGRSLPSGRISRTTVSRFVVLTALAYWCTTFLFVLLDGNWLPFAFALPVLFTVYAYSLSKRITYLCHVLLGIAIGIAPVCAAVAVNEYPDTQSLLLAIALGTWVVGFDLVYSCLDADVDSGLGVYSMSSRFGVPATLLAARLCHVTTAITLLLTGFLCQNCGWIYYLGTGASILVLVYQHSFVSPNDLSQIESKFFGLNNAVSLTWFAGLLVDTLLV